MSKQYVLLSVGRQVFAGKHPLSLCKRNYSSVVDQMLEYASTTYKADNPSHDAAADVLSTGLGIPGISGVETARLYICRAELEADRGRWKTASQMGLDAVAAARQADARTQLLAAALATRALIALGGDGDKLAVRTATQYAGLGSQAVLLHALASTSSSSTTQEEELLQHQQAAQLLLQLDGASAVQVDSLERLLAQLAVGAWQAKTGRLEAASSRFSDLAAAAAAGRTAGGAAAFEGVPSSVLAELEAEGLLGQAQSAALVAEDFSALEEILGRALTAGEAAGSRGPRGLGNARLSAALLIIGYTYARSARVTFAEGIFRKAAALTGLDVQHLVNAMATAELARDRAAAEARKATASKATDGPTSSASSSADPTAAAASSSHSSSTGSAEQANQAAEEESAVAAAAVAMAVEQVVSHAAAAGIHPLLAAALGWRFFQLLSALPNRGNEAAAWKLVSRALWQRGGAVSDIEVEFGGGSHLMGRGPKPRLETQISLWNRRVRFGSGSLDPKSA